MLQEQTHCPAQIRSSYQMSHGSPDAYGLGRGWWSLRGALSHLWGLFHLHTIPIIPRSPGGVLCVLDSRFMSGHVGQLIMRTLTISPGSPLGPGGPVMPGIPGRPWKNKQTHKSFFFFMKKCRTPFQDHLKLLFFLCFFKSKTPLNLNSIMTYLWSWWAMRSLKICALVSIKHKDIRIRLH